VLDPVAAMRNAVDVHPHFLCRYCLTPLLCFLAISQGSADTVEEYAARVAPLIDPAKLATLGEKAANPRVQKYTAWLEIARRDGVNPTNVVDAALVAVGITNKAAEVTRTVMLRNLKIAGELGCFDDAGMNDMRRGQSPTICKGPYKGQELTVDHIIPRSFAPELDNVIANLELLPAKLNAQKGSKLGQRQRDLARKLFEAGLLSPEGWNKLRAL
jgi:hypothetical protein